MQHSNGLREASQQASSKERLLTPPEPRVSWVFPISAQLTYGRRKGELYVFCVGTGIGKTLASKLMHQSLRHTPTQDRAGD